MPVVGGEEQEKEMGEATSAPANETSITEMEISNVNGSSADPVVASSAAPAASGSDMQTLLDQESEGPQVKKGEILEGTIVQTTPTAILVDIGLKSEGVITDKELSRMDRESIESLKVGEKVLVYVLNPENQEGHVVLSLSRAQEEQDWRKADEMRTSAEIFMGKVDGFNKGGLIVRFGRVRGFVPESQVSNERRTRAAGADPQDKWGGMRGEEIYVKVLEVDRARNRLILSEREAAPQIREKQKERLIDELQVGDVKVGYVKSLADFGAFVDVGGADGLVHLTELSWKHINHPKEILHVGQKVEVEVISVDRDRKRIGLSIKKREEDPWVAAARKYQKDQLVKATITKLTKFGAFAKLDDDPEIEGLIHISELANHRVGHPKEVVSEGESVTLRVVKIEEDQRRIGLSLKRVSSPEYFNTDFNRATGKAAPAPQQPDVIAPEDLDAVALKEDERRRRKNKKKKDRDFDDDEDDYEDDD